MEPRLENLNKMQAFKTSPMQSLLNRRGKGDVIQYFKGQLWQAWSVPLVLTFLEIVCLKHGKLQAANNFALFKFASIPVSFGLSFYYYEKLQHKMLYFDGRFPYAPQSQLELIRDQQMAKLKGN